MHAVFQATLSGHEKSVNVVRFSTCGKYLATGGDDGLLLVWTLDEERSAEVIYVQEFLFRVKLITLFVRPRFEKITRKRHKKYGGSSAALIFPLMSTILRGRLARSSSWSRRRTTNASFST